MRTIITWVVYIVALFVCGLTMVNIGYSISTYQYWIVVVCMIVSFTCGEERDLGRREKK